MGGANGANRLSGNALPEAMVFGERAGEAASRFTRGKQRSPCDKAAAPHVALIREARARNAGNHSPMCLMGELKELMWSKVGPFRIALALRDALDRIRALRESELPTARVSSERVHNTSLVEWFELRSGLYAAEALALSALHRRESRGAHQRDDFPTTRPEYDKNQRLWLASGKLTSSFEGLRT